MSGEPTVIYSASSTQQAYLLKGLLEDRGIATWVVNDAMQIAGGELPLGWTAAAKVVVGLTDAEEARRLAEEFDRRTAEGTAGDAPAIEADAKEWPDWPLCPACGERRAARCPIDPRGSACPAVLRRLRRSFFAAVVSTLCSLRSRLRRWHFGCDRANTGENRRSLNVRHRRDGRLRCRLCGLFPVAFCRQNRVSAA
jgi:hypothetical protein